MKGQPSQFDLPSHIQYVGTQNIPFHSGHGPYGAVTPAHVPYSYSGRAQNGFVNADYFDKSSKCVQIANAVQKYLDFNCNESDVNHKWFKQDISLCQLSFPCEPCKRSFQDKSSLDAHIKTHVKCDFPNCSFIASRQMLKLHEIQCHREGKMKIVLDTQEQIAKWREERKRNYPTVTNVARKEAEQQRRIESGQTVKTKEFRYNTNQGWKQQRGKRNSRGRNIQRRDNDISTESQDVKFQITEFLHEEQNAKCTLQDGNLLNLHSKHTDGNEKETAERLTSLSALAAAYATSSSDEDDINDQNLKQKVLEDNKQPILVEDYQTAENKKQKLKEINFRKLDKKEKRKASEDRSRRKMRKTVPGPNHPRPTLLEMLLAPDIRHERNVMLQCIRYIVKRNFFGIECEKNI